MPARDVTPLPEAGSFPGLLRRYRTARRLSQLDLALTCEISARHLSFLETGRASPSREMVQQLSEGLLLPLGARNALLQAAGFAPVYPASPLSSQALGPFRQILTEMMDRHAPYPALLCDRHWNVLDASPVARRLLAALQDDPGETNLIRMLTSSRAAEAAIANLAEMLAEMQGRIHLEALEAADDDVLSGLLSALEEAMARHPLPGGQSARSPLVPLTLRTPGGELRFLSTVAHFGTSEDVTIRDLRLELLFPADDATRTAIAEIAASLGT
ncbi:DNA-binding protein [Hyphomonas neptunium ATCC 15444]|uniref:DNA-binding protein n=2 Tax=Hyphomonas TaxID=85 RepID=Q0BWI7_HYPNA|nr:MULTISPECIES: helix-turn-helix transcriptional regulator [Hyphomonas]ABI76892.1 DNA-binding protein [Hyphomonas neptunium ATCC 15444]KCZ94732.1 DNA-binding protein [Hyphomonas hirschiana VP5]